LRRGCKDPNAAFQDYGAEITDNSLCGYYDPPKPAPPLPSYCKTISFTGSQSDWQSGCACLGIKYTCKDNGYDRFKIYWGDGTTQSSTHDCTLSEYNGVTFTHTYCTPGNYTPYVEIQFENCGCIFADLATANKSLGPVIVKKPDLTSIINLLLD
jgi:hypothetical protein